MLRAHSLETGIRQSSFYWHLFYRVMEALVEQHNVEMEAESFPPKIKSQESTGGGHVNPWTKCNVYKIRKIQKHFMAQRMEDIFWEKEVIRKDVLMR